MNYMKKKKATNKQIIDAYGQSYRLMQKAKQHDGILQKTFKQMNWRQTDILK